MGLRITDHLRRTDYDVRHMEVSERGRALLAARGIEAVPARQALEARQVVILALPDNRIAQVAASTDPLLRPGMMQITPDIAAPLARGLPARDVQRWRAQNY